MVVTTRRLEELQVECTTYGISWNADMGREELMDLLRDKIGTPDPSVEIDPMKAKDLKADIDWAAKGADRFRKITSYFNDNWVMEPKLDGCRLRLFLGATANSMNSGRRSVKTFAYSNRSDNFPHLRDAVIPALNGTIIDGELLAPNSRIQTHTGLWTDSLLNASVALVNAKPAGSVATQERFGKAEFHVFDVMMCQGVSTHDLPYHQRREVLELVVEKLQDAHPGCNVRLVPQYESADYAIENALALGYEGVMIKSKNGHYQPGRRSSEWLKVKAYSSADAFVTDWAPGESSNAGLVGSLDLSVVEADGTYRAVAQVGNLTAAMRREISAPDGSLKPEFYGTVIEFQAQGLGKNGRARHAHMTRLRPDKDLNQCGVDQLEIFAKV